LISKRLLVESETFNAMRTKKALESIEYLTTKQLYILGYLHIIEIVDKSKNNSTIYNMNFNKYIQYLHNMFLFCSVDVNLQDVEYLEDLNLIKILLNREVFLVTKIFPIYHDKKAEINNFFKAGLGHKISTDWEVNGLKYANLTRTGAYIGKTLGEVWTKLAKPL